MYTSYVYVRLSVYVTKWARRATAAKRLVVIGSFGRSIPLVWCGLMWRFHMTWIDYLASCRSDLSDENRLFVTIFSRFAKELIQITRKLQCTVIRKISMGFQAWPLPLFGGGVENKCESCNFPLLNDKILHVFPVNNFQRPSCLHIMYDCSYVWETFVSQFSKSMHDYTFNSYFTAPLAWRECANFERSWFRNRLHLFTLSH